LDGCDAAGALVILFVIAFMPRISEEDRIALDEMLRALIDSSQDEWLVHQKWVKLAECIFLGGPMIAFGEEVRNLFLGVIVAELPL
jgi:hypothetical protein